MLYDFGVYDKDDDNDEQVSRRHFIRCNPIKFLFIASQSPFFRSGDGRFYWGDVANDEPNQIKRKPFIIDALCQTNSLALLTDPMECGLSIISRSAMEAWRSCSGCSWRCSLTIWVRVSAAEIAPLARRPPAAPKKGATRTTHARGRWASWTRLGARSASG